MSLLDGWDKMEAQAAAIRRDKRDKIEAVESNLKKIRDLNQQYEQSSLVRSPTADSEASPIKEDENIPQIDSITYNSAYYVLNYISGEGTRKKRGGRTHPIAS